MIFVQIVMNTVMFMMRMRNSMKRATISIIHFLLAACAFIFSARLHGQNDLHMLPDPVLIADPIDKVLPEIIAYQLVPSQDAYCHFDIQFIDPRIWDDMPLLQVEEIEEILIDRIVFEETNRYAVNEVFVIDDQPYLLVRVPFTGFEW